MSPIAQDKTSLFALENLASEVVVIESDLSMRKRHRQPLSITQ